ncbi:MAG TPA: hypothetical protein VF275_04495 [Gammaproteobacteria bacterium]
MRFDLFRLGRIFYAMSLALLLAACGGGGGDNNDGGPNNPAPVAGDCMGTGSVMISGVVEYEFVPAVDTGTGAKLDYAASEFRPIRGGEVRAIAANGSETYSSAVTGEQGEYCLTVPENVSVTIRVRATMPGMGVSVVDNTRNQAIWSAQGESIDSGTGSLEVNLRAASGWGGSGYSSTRAAAPFAILDSVYTAMQKVRQVDPDVNFPALKLNWSPENRSCTGGSFPFSDGCIGTSFYANYGGSAGRNIFILGNAGIDTDEYDNHVVIHEWGHYYEDAFARSDSIGGAHGGGDALDPRVAFGEGWGNAFSGITTDDPVYVDTQGNNQANGFIINVEDGFEGAMGWWNEATVQEIIYDLYDSTPSEDAAALGFAPIHAVLTGGQRNTSAMTTIFSFIHFLKQYPGISAADIRDVVASHDIAVINDEWGDSRDNGTLLGAGGDDGSEFGAGYEDYVSPVYVNLLTVTDNHSINVCTTNAVDPASASEYNRLGVRRFLRFEVGTSGEWLITLAGAAGSDPDFYVRLNGENVASGEETGTTEIETASLSSGRIYVIEVLDWDNADDDSASGGTSCLDLTFEQN